MTALLCAERLSFSWRGRPVLCEASLVIDAGALVVLRGRNGAGKTTLLRLLAGALEPDGGAVRRGGGDGGRLAPAAPALVSAGDRGLYARLDVRANVDLAVALALASRRRRRELVAAALERFGLQGLARQRVDRLSTGQRQRVRLAVGFAAHPRVLLLDEPDVSLDSAGTALLAAALQEFAAGGSAAMWTTASSPSAVTAATAAYTLADGRVRAC